MKVTVTHLKAPWPAGTVPGHVVEFPGLATIPAWAVGKCVPAADDAAVTLPADPPELVVNPASAAPDLDDIEAQAQAERAQLQKPATKGKPKA